MSRNQVYTVFVMTGPADAVRKLRVPRRWLVNGALALAALAVVGGVTVTHYCTLLGSASENQVLREENAQLRSQIQLVQEKVTEISATLDRVESYDAKLRTAATQLQDPQRNLAIGPVGGEGESGEPAPAPAAESNLNALPGKVGSLAEEAARQERSLRDLQEYFDDQRSLLASTPSIWPVRGWVTSDFGARLDPYTADRKMHEGLDIAAAVGQPVYAPSDGTVVFAGLDGGYGNVLVIDHGYGVKTRYGHLSAILVRAGARVGRGDKVALVGSTGRSTGPHLHYEVRVDGVPENPRKFILE